MLKINTRKQLIYKLYPLSLSLEINLKSLFENLYLFYMIGGHEPILSQRDFLWLSPWRIIF